MTLAQSVKGGLFRGVTTAEGLLNLSRPSAPLAGITNFLLLQHASALGTAIHATPIVPALRDAVPGCRIAVVASGFALDVFRNNPGVDELIETPSPLKDLKGAVRALRARHPFRDAGHVALTTTGNERTKIAAQAVLSGATPRVGFTVVPELYRVPMSFDYALSQIANNLRIVEALGHKAKFFEPEIFFTQAEREAAQETLAASGVRQGQRVAVFVTQTSVTQRKSWRKERFQAVARFLVEHYGMHIVFVGTGAEAAAIEDLKDGLEFATTSVAGKTKLPALAALMSLATVGVTLDTGPMHIGRAVGLPMVIIAPAWSPPVEWLPVGDSRFRILKNADMPAATPEYIIDEVSVEDVTTALTELV